MCARLSEGRATQVRAFAIGKSGVRALNRRNMTSKDGNPLIDGREGPLGTCVVEGLESVER